MINFWEVFMLLKKEHFENNDEIYDEVIRRHAEAFLNWSGCAIANFFNYQTSARDVCFSNDLFPSLQKWRDFILDNNIHAFSISILRQRSDNISGNSDLYVDTLYLNKHHRTHSAIVLKQQNIPQKFIEEGLKITVGEGGINYLNAPKLSSSINTLPFYSIAGMFNGIKDALGIFG